MSNRIIRICDDRSGRMDHVAVHQNVPEEWTVEEILRRFSIARHLRVYEDINGRARVIQQGASP